MMAVDNLTKNPENQAGEFLQELDQVLLAANHKLDNESQLEADAEILENIKYEIAQTSWLDLLPARGAIITIGTCHPECESVTGQLLFANANAVGLETGAFKFLVLNTHIVWLSALQGKANSRRQSVLDPFALNLLFNDLLDQQGVNTWFLSGGKSLSGKLVRVFSDSLEINFGDQRVTLLLDQVVAIRTQS